MSSAGAISASILSDLKERIVDDGQTFSAVEWTGTGTLSGGHLPYYHGLETTTLEPITNLLKFRRNCVGVQNLAAIRFSEFHRRPAHTTTQLIMLSSVQGSVYMYTLPSYLSMTREQLVSNFSNGNLLGHPAKIGHTFCNVRDRIKQQLAAEDAKVLLAMPCSDAIAMEQHVHRVLAGQGKNIITMAGSIEWFMTTKEEVYDIISKRTAEEQGIALNDSRSLKTTGHAFVTSHPVQADRIPILNVRVVDSIKATVKEEPASGGSNGSTKCMAFRFQFCIGSKDITIDEINHVNAHVTSHHGNFRRVLMMAPVPHEHGYLIKGGVQLVKRTRILSIYCIFKTLVEQEFSGLGVSCVFEESGNCRMDKHVISGTQQILNYFQ
jgi:hypothetical protein